MEKEIQTLKEFIHEKFESHEELEALRFKRIDELLSQYGKESEGNSETIKRVHIRVDRIEQSYKTLKGFGTAIVTCLTGVGAWFGLINNKQLSVITLLPMIINLCHQPIYFLHFS